MFQLSKWHYTHEIQKTMSTIKIQNIHKTHETTIGNFTNNKKKGAGGWGIHRKTQEI